MRLLMLFIGLSLSTLNFCHAQLDTIAGPFIVGNVLEAGANSVFIAVVEFGALEVRRVDLTEEGYPQTPIFVNGAGGPVTSLYIDGSDMYLTTSGATISQGQIYKVSDIYGDNASWELILELPWLPTDVAVYENTLYIHKFFYFGGNIYTYDMNDSDAEVELFVDTNQDAITDLKIYNDLLLICNREQGKIKKIDLKSANSFMTNVQTNLGEPVSIDVDNDLLYVAVANQNNNTSSRIQIYDFNGSASSDPLEEVADNTKLVIADVARVNNETYLLEYPFEIGEEGYLMKVSNSTSSIEDIQSSSILAYPNPTQGVIRFDDFNPTSLTVYNSIGSKVEIKYYGNNELDFSNLPAGMYSIIFQNQDQKIERLQIIKQ